MFLRTMENAGELSKITYEHTENIKKNTKVNY